MTTSCCCTGTPKAPCRICVEGDNIAIDTGVGFLFDGDVFSGVTDATPQIEIIPNGCVNPITGASTACRDVLELGWNLSQVNYLGHDGDDCLDYFGRVIDCATVPCWWYGEQYLICPNLCHYSSTPSGIDCPYNDEIRAQIVIDASSDPDYVLLTIQVTTKLFRLWCCLHNSTSGAPVTRMRVFYRVRKDAFTCLCSLCFAKYDTELVGDIPGDVTPGTELPCLNFPDFIKVNARYSGATAEQGAAAAALCSDPAYQPNIDCASVAPGCGETACSYTADADKIWQYTSGICINGCICPDNNALILAGYPRAGYVGQVLTVTIGCTPGERPCSELLGRCCSKDGDGENVCTDNISECDCYLLTGGCWTIGGGIDCAHAGDGACPCAPIVGICCWDGNCLDGVTQSACSDASGGTGCWVEQNEAGDFTCATDHGGCSGCGDVCVGDCTYFPVEDLINGGYPWTIIDQTCPMTPQCTCPNEAPTTGPGAIPPATMEQWEAGTRVTTGCDGRLPPAGRMMAATPMMASAPAPSQPLTLLQKATSLVTTMAKTVVAGELASEEVIQQRLEICSGCPKFQNNSCTLCGCAVNRDKVLANKLAHISSVCPDNPPRW